MHASSARWTFARLLARSVARPVALSLLASAALAGLGSLSGCTHAGGAPPVDSPIYAFQPADPDDYSTDADSDDSGDDSGGGDAPDDSGE